MRILLSLLFAVIGAVLAVDGVRLAMLGGSPYFIVFGVVMVVTAILILNRSIAARWLYALLLIGLAVWSWSEVGYDWWPLASRMGMFLILGLLLLLPYGVREPRFERAWLPLFLVTAVIGLGTLGALTQDKYAITGDLPTEIANADPDMGPVAGDEDWIAYGRTQYGQRFSPIDQITPENVTRLEAAWSYQTGDLKQPGDSGEFTYQATPIKIGNTLYLCTPHNWAIALDADSGTEKWVYKANIQPDSNRQHQTCRGVSYWPGDDSRAVADTPAAIPDARVGIRPVRRPAL